MSAAAEQKVKKLARLPGNSVCANCGTAKKFGFSTVCIKFHTFVCNNCKSSHQAISHRCKSLTMSSWTDAEVAELQAKGNDYARRTWLKNAPPIGTGGRPKEGDHVDVFKRFVVDAYERKRYYGQDDGVQMAAPQQQVATAVPVSMPSAAAARRVAARAPVSAPVRVQAPVAAPPPPAPAPAPDLLGFSSAAPAPAPVAFEANFDAFGATPSPAPASSSFSFISSPPAAPTPAPTPAAAPSGFGFISAPPAAPAPIATPATSTTTNNNNFADFAGMSAPASTGLAAAPVPAVKKPVMSNSSMTQKASLISSMDSMASPQPPMGFGSGMQGGMGGMSNGFGGMGMNGQGMSQQQQQMMMMQQQQQMMMQQQAMGMGGMMNNNMNMMGGGMNQMGMGMMSTQQMMNFGGSSQPNNQNRNMNSANAMNSLSMSGMDMSAWTTGSKK